MLARASRVTPPPFLRLVALRPIREGVTVVNRARSKDMVAAAVENRVPPVVPLRCHVEPTLIGYGIVTSRLIAAMMSRSCATLALALQERRSSCTANVVHRNNFVAAAS